MQILFVYYLETIVYRVKELFFFPYNNILSLTRSSLFSSFLLQLLNRNFTNFCVCVGQIVFEHVC